MNTKAENISKSFDNTMEKEIYSLWEKSGYFKPENVEEHLKEKSLEVNRKYTMTLPPPNANGDLHMGHTCGYSFHDAMGRFKRMTGHPTLLIAGKDHAGIQTETVFSKRLKADGIDKWELGREEFNKRCYEFCITSANNARSQEKRIGLSADWDREFFTLDPRLTDIVYETFYSMLKEGLVYRDKRIINQCPSCKTALADIDTYHKELPGIFAYIVYPFVNEEDNKRALEKFGVAGITVATTRPETMLGDTAVAVNSKDERFKEFVGKKLMLPFVNREIPIITDDGIDMETGTGALKVTPAHSPVDFEIAARNNLPIVNVINEEGKMSGDIPEEFKGMDTVECSKALVAKLQEMGLFVKLERIKHDVAVCERCDTPIQPIISFQWYVNTKPMAEMALKSLHDGTVKVNPEGQQRALEYFYENIQPWCISRQLWWGHRIPVWYSGSRELHDWLIDNPNKTVNDFEIETGKKPYGTGKVYPQVEMPVGEKDEVFEEEKDVFDTWFSSGQWPFSTTTASFGKDNEYYPTDVMVHARDILFWWTGRMLMLGHYKTGKAPFHTVFLHGIINAPDGTKMSKSKGNTVSPVELFDKYGADALRLWYFTDALPGSNAPLREEKIKGNRNFINKIWNASRFVMMNIEEEEVDEVKVRIKEVESQSQEWVELNDGKLRDTYSFIYQPFGGDKDTLEFSASENYKRKIYSGVLNYYENHKFNLVSESIRSFFWNTYCDQWIGEYKEEIQDSSVRIEKLTEMVLILKLLLKIMHPMIPFITEAVWQELIKFGLIDDSILMIEQI